MTDAFKKFSKDIADKIIAQLSGAEMQDFVAKTKAAAAESGTFKVVISTENQDRQGEIVKQDGIDMTRYLMSPVVLWGHDYNSPPIAVCTSIYREEGKTIAEGVFAPADANPFAQQIRKLYDLGMCRATSVGFIPLEIEGNVITKSELLEFSFVSVPANPYALSLRQVRASNLDLNMFVTKGIELVVKEDEPDQKKVGDPCEMPDGKPGTMQEVDGALVCVMDPEHMEDEKSDKEKGQIADQLSDEQVRDKKWENMCKVFDLVDAMCSVYFDDATGVEAFNDLTKELATLISGLGTGTVPTEESKILKAVAQEKSVTIINRLSKQFTMLKKEVTPEQVGAITAKLQADIDALIIQASKDLQALVPISNDITVPKGATNGGSGDSPAAPAAEDPAGEPAAKKRSKASEFTGNEDTFFMLLTALKQSSHIISDAIGRSRGRLPR